MEEKINVIKNQIGPVVFNQVFVQQVIAICHKPEARQSQKVVVITGMRDADFGAWTLDFAS
jgi:hypothetical protein